jgi:hypothetical protein
MSMFAAAPGFAQTGGASEGAGTAVVSNETVGTVAFFTFITALVVGAIASTDDSSSAVTHE